MTISYIISNQSITLFLNGDLHVISSESNSNFQAIKEAIRDGRSEEEIMALVNAPAHEIIELGGGKIKIVEGQIYVGDRPVVNRLTDRLIAQLKEGFDVEPMANFLANLIENPSKRALDELYSWMEACDMPITPDGHLLAFKRIRGNWRDIYSNTLDNSVGKVVSIPRNMVDEDKYNTCSHGLHFCSMDYLQCYSSADPATDRIVVLKINPRDVVAIPNDYQNKKGRCSRYEVIAEIPRDNVKFYSQTVHDFDDDDDEDYEPKDFWDLEPPDWDSFENQSDSQNVSSQEAINMMSAALNGSSDEDTTPSKPSPFSDLKGLVISRVAALALTGVDDDTFDEWLEEGRMFAPTSDRNYVTVL